jgi:hypothetical protein
MAAINDITGDSIQTRTITKEFQDGHERIFGKKEKSGTKRWIQDPVTFKLIPADEYYAPTENAGPYIQDDVKPYQSMIDGRMIEGRRDHREHLKRNNCVEAADMPLKNPERPKDNSLKERLIYEVMERHRGKWK